MSPEKQRIAIAKACGIVTSDQWGPLYRTAFGLVRDCPDYLNDLNAMHEAEGVLNGLLVLKYTTGLRAITGGGSGSFSHIHGTAAQRAEAFLRTIGKWEDEQ
jgi:hypothetical protein